VILSDVTTQNQKKVNIFLHFGRKTLSLPLYDHWSSLSRNEKKPDSKFYPSADHPFWIRSNGQTI